MSKVFTPPNLRETILDRVSNYYDSNLRDTNKVDFEENHSYDSRSGSEERTDPKQGQRRIIEPEDENNTDNETSNLNQSKESLITNSRRKMISRIDVNSLESEDEYIDCACTELNESSTSRLIEPFYQDLNNHRHITTRTQPQSLQERRDLKTKSIPTTTMNSRGKPISDIKVNSLESDNDCINYDYNGSRSTSKLIEPFYQGIANHR